VLLSKKVEAGRYVIIPCTFDPGQESKFFLQILSDKPDVHAVEMGEHKGTLLASQWKGESAGGCMYVIYLFFSQSDPSWLLNFVFFFFPNRNHSSWRKNPHFFLKVTHKTTFSLQLAQQGTRHVIGFYILKSDKNGMTSIYIFTITSKKVISFFFYFR